jgi:hypothetical protein
MKKYELTFLRRLNNFAISSFNLIVIITILPPLCIFATLLKFIINGISGVIDADVITDTLMRVGVSSLLWFYTLKLLFKQNRRNIALFICIRRRLKSKKN